MLMKQAYRCEQVLQHLNTQSLVCTPLKFVDLSETQTCALNYPGIA